MSEVTCQHQTKRERGKPVETCGRDAAFLVDRVYGGDDVPVCAHHSLEKAYTNRRRIEEVVGEPARETARAQTEEAARAGPEPPRPPFGHEKVIDVEVEYVAPESQPSEEKPK
jgi:hypothetical protein